MSASGGRVAGLVLAAGGSSRMGRPKPLLPFGRDTVVGAVCAAALSAGLDPVLVVVGDRAAEVRATLDGRPVRPVENPDWRAGQGRSLAVGVRALEALDADRAAEALDADREATEPGPEATERGGEADGSRAGPVLGAAVLLGDEPEIAPPVIRGAVRAWRASGQPALRTWYRDRPGHPVVLARALFPDLRDLTGDEGAAGLLEALGDRVARLRVDRPAPADLDRPADYRALLARRGGR